MNRGYCRNRGTARADGATRVFRILIPSRQPFPLHAIQSVPQRLRDSRCRFERPRLALTVMRLGFQLLAPDARVMHVSRLMDGKVRAGLGVSAVHLFESARLFRGDARHLRLIGIKRSQRLGGRTLASDALEGGNQFLDLTERLSIGDTCALPAHALPKIEPQ